MPAELLDRAITFWRIGWYAWAAVSWTAFRIKSPPGLFIGEVQSAIDAGDWLKAADIAQFKIRPTIV